MSVENSDIGPCVRDNDELLDRWSGGYLTDDEWHDFHWHLFCCEKCLEFVRDLVERNLLSVLKCLP